MAGLEGLTFTTQSPFTLRCFQCGEFGHINKNNSCPNEPTALGDEVWLKYKKWKKKDAKNYTPVVVERNYTAIFAKWMSDEPQDLIQDVFNVAKKRNTKNATHDFTCAYRAYFQNRQISITAALTTLASNIKDSAVDDLNINLNHAVRVGKPPTFTDEEANIIYSRDRYPTRVRYVYTALMTDFPVTNYTRSLLLPSSPNELRTVKIASVGSGPANDYVAFSFVRDFLHESQNERVPKSRTKLHCVNYDLFSADWAPIVKTITDATKNEDDIIEDKMMDLRLPLDSPTNTHLHKTIEEFDVILFTFVLHENRSHCEQRDEDNNITGLSNAALSDILRRAKLNATIIALDAGNRLFGTMKEVAENFGWEGEIPTKRWKFGARSGLMLRRKKLIE